MFVVLANRRHPFRCKGRIDSKTCPHGNGYSKAAPGAASMVEMVGGRHRHNYNHCNRWLDNWATDSGDLPAGRRVHVCEYRLVPAAFQRGIISGRKETMQN